MMRYGKAYGGTDPELIEGDIFKTIIKYPDTTSYADQPVNPLLNILFEEGVLGAKKIREELGFKDRAHVRNCYITPALAENLIEMTLPDKPKSRLQKYRLTEKGRTCLLKSANHKA